MSKKLVIPKESLPNLTSNNTALVIRFRIVSTDKNRVSAWTPIYTMIKPQVFVGLTESNDSFLFTLI